MNHKSRKNLSAAGLFSKMKKLAKKLPNQINGTRKEAISLADCLMSALAMFALKFPSLLSFDKAYQSDEAIVHNLRTLFFVNNAPSDTYRHHTLKSY